MKKITGSWKMITAMKECPACKSRYDTGISLCPRDNSNLTDILVTTYPSGDGRQQERQQEMLSQLKAELKKAALSNDVTTLREGYINLANLYREYNQPDKALIYFHKAEIIEPGDAATTKLREIIELHLQQLRIDKALEVARRIAILYSRQATANETAEYFKHLIALRPSDLKWVKEILAILDESGLAVESSAPTTEPKSEPRSETLVEIKKEESRESENVVRPMRMLVAVESPPLVSVAVDSDDADDMPLLEDLVELSGEDVVEMPVNVSAPVTAVASANEAVAPPAPPENVIIAAQTPSTIPSPETEPSLTVVGDVTNGSAATVNATSTPIASAPATTPPHASTPLNLSGRPTTGSHPLPNPMERSTSGEYRMLTPRSTGGFRISGEVQRLSFSDQIVMIVDDDAAVRELLAELLGEFGCRVIEAMDGEEAIERLKDTLPSFIISDIVMPRRDGYGLFEYLQNNESLCEIPFIFLTGRGEIDEKLSALEGGVEDYWLKPFDIEEINIRLRRMLQKVRLAGDVRGKLSEMPLPDLLQSLASGNKSGVLHLSRSGRAGVIYIDQGRIIDATFEDLAGKTAIYCLVNWCMGGGNFNFHSQAVDREVAIKQSIQGILMEAMRRRDEESRLIEQLPPGDVFMAVNTEDNPDFFSADFSDETTRILQLFDGTHSLKECLHCLQGDLETIQTVVALNKAGLLRIVDFGIQ